MATHQILFACPGMPADAVRAKYTTALAPLDHHLGWIAPAGRSAVFAQEALKHRDPNGRILPRLLAAHGAKGNPPATVSLVCFSAGYGLARELLRNEYDREAVDGLVLLDALHAGFDADHTAGDAQLEPFVQYARLALAGKAAFVLGHTDVQTPQAGPGAFASTTQSTDELCRLLDVDAAPALPGGIRLRSGGMLVRSYDERAAAHAKAEHGLALTGWGPELVAEWLVPHLQTAPHFPPLTPPQCQPVGAATSLPEALLAQARADLDVSEEPPGSNDGRRIREMAARFGLRPPLAWCAVAASTWLREACEQLGVRLPIQGSPGALAIMAQLQQAGEWLSADAIRKAPAERLRPGMVVVWKRPPRSWTGHVGVLESYDPGSQTMHTIEGNSGPRHDRVGRMVRPLSDPLWHGAGSVG